VPRLDFEELVEVMMHEDLKGAERDALCQAQGYPMLHSQQRGKPGRVSGGRLLDSQRLLGHAPALLARPLLE
jgi:hypothetical protein